MREALRVLGRPLRMKFDSNSRGMSVLKFSVG